MMQQMSRFEEEEEEGTLPSSKVRFITRSCEMSGQTVNNRPKRQDFKRYFSSGTPE